MYYRKYLEVLKTRHQWRMAMRDVITREVTPLSDSHGADPTACQMKQHGDSDTACRDSSSSSSSNGNNLLTTDNNNNDTDDDIFLIEEKQKAVREPIPAHKTVTRKRGDQEVQIELYGLWQTGTYKVGHFRCVPHVTADTSVFRLSQQRVPITMRQMLIDAHFVTECSCNLICATPLDDRKDMSCSSLSLPLTAIAHDC